MEDKKKETSPTTSPSISSSQGDMADTEDIAPNQLPKDSPPAPPPKKKRTRTLTTPHQAAVLHALLAQSRFPTTAMREEVGRSIGLSARKVQIWFQNQRQKARRPRGQNIPPLTRPPQFGPFPSIPSGSTISGPSTSPTATASQAGLSSERLRELRPAGESSGSYPSPGRASSSPDSESYGFRDSFSSEGYSSSLISSQLSGPGVPGSLVPDYHSAPPHTERPQHELGHPASSFYGERSNRPFTADDSGRIAPDRRLPPLPPRRSLDADFPITLPPLRLPPTLGGAVSGNERPRTVPTPAEPGPEGYTRSSAESPFAYEAPVRIPPPFTLQPPPQWDDPSFSPFSRRLSHAGITHHRFPHDTLTPPHSADYTLRSEGSFTSLPSSRSPTVLPPISPFDRRPSFPSPLSPLTSGYFPARHSRYIDDNATLRDQDVTP